MLSRVVIAAVLIVALMVAVKDGRLLRQAGLTGSCHLVQSTSDGGEWDACSSGRLAGRPDLTARSCTSSGVHGKLEYWRCPARIESQAAG